MTTLPPDASESGARGNVAELLVAVAAEFPQRAAVIGSAGVRTWADVDAAAFRGVASLDAMGLTAGDRVLLALPTGADIVAAYFALARAGMVAVPVSPQRADQDVIAERVLAAATISTGSAVGGLPRIGVEEVASWWTATTDPAGSATPSGEMRAGGEDLAMLARGGAEHPVMISHRAVLAAVTAISATDGLHLQPDDRALQVLPLHHLAGWVTAFLPLTTAGAASVVPDLPEEGGRWIQSVVDAVRRHRVTVIPAAPGLYRRLREVPGVERALASVRLMTSAAAQLDPADSTAIRALTGQPVWEGYGIAEATSAISTTLLTSAPRAGSVGCPLPGTEIRIISDEEPTEVSDFSDSPESMESSASAAAEASIAGSASAGDDEIVAPLANDGEVGLIAIRGDNLFSGYWPDGAGGPGADGWFVTGDIGYLDDGGELHLVDRAAEAITVAGFTVYPREVEDVLTRHPYVRDAAVVGVPGRAGEAVIAVLVANRGTRPTPDDLDEFVAARLPLFKRPLRYRLVARLPRTEVGRVDRDAVRAEYLADPDPELLSGLHLAGGETAGPLRTAGAAPARSVLRQPGRHAQDSEEELF